MAGIIINKGCVFGGHGLTWGSVILDDSLFLLLVLFFFFLLFLLLLFIPLLLLFLFLFIHERHTQRGRHRRREKQAPCREPDAGLHPGISGSHPEPKADTQPLSHPGILKFLKFIETFSVALHVIYP